MKLQLSYDGVCRSLWFEESGVKKGNEWWSEKIAIFEKCACDTDGHEY